VGFIVGFMVGFIVGFMVGFIVGFMVGFIVGFMVGFIVGFMVGFIVGCMAGARANVGSLSLGKTLTTFSSGLTSFFSSIHFHLQGNNFDMLHICFSFI
jgi:hypothetical protein